jgi:protein-S-isoprenylcysteine O-methyltransferase Ste14
MELTIKIIIFLIASFGIFWISRLALSNRQHHGFYRFFSWEVILILFLLNVNLWFKNPLSFRQIISWISLLISLGLIIAGVTSLQSQGKIDKNHMDVTLLGIEKTTLLVTTGIYHYIRHPFYSSLLFLGWGIFLKNLTWTGMFLVMINTILVFVTAQKEEAENIRFFGTLYQNYMDKTKLFVPFLF